MSLYGPKLLHTGPVAHSAIRIQRAPGGPFNAAPSPPPPAPGQAGRPDPKKGSICDGMPRTDDCIIGCLCSWLPSILLLLPLPRT